MLQARQCAPRLAPVLVLVCLALVDLVRCLHCLRCLRCLRCLLIGCSTWCCST